MKRDARQRAITCRASVGYDPFEEKGEAPSFFLVEEEAPRLSSRHAGQDRNRYLLRSLVERSLLNVTTNIHADNNVRLERTTGS